MNEDPNLDNETETGEQEPKAPAEPSQPTPPEPDYKEKFSQSTRENQLIVEENKALKAQLAERNLTKEPTDSELQAAFPAWEAMSETERSLARRTLAAERIAGNAVSSLDEIKAERSWNTTIEVAIASNNALQGKEREFRQYASRYKNTSMDVLVPAFLQSQGAAQRASNPTPGPARPSLLPGTGGPKTPDKPKKLTADELRTLRKTDEKAYTAYIKANPDALDDDL